MRANYTQDKNVIINIGGKAMTVRWSNLIQKNWANICFVISALLAALFWCLYPNDVEMARAWIFNSIALKLFLLIAIFSFAIIALHLMNHLAFLALLFLIIILIILAGCMAIVMFDMTLKPKIFLLFGVFTEKEAIEFIALGMGGVLATIGAIAFVRRASAQEKNNDLIEKRRDDDRFQNLISGLGDKRMGVRIATFHRFYYLALKTRGENDGKFEKDVFEILCSCFRAMSSGIPDIPTPDNTPKDTTKSASLKEEYEYRTESQILFDILFKGRFKSPEKKISDSREDPLIDNDFNVNLQNVCLVDIDFSNANISGVNFRNARFENINLKQVYCVEGANFCGTTINDEKISQGYFPEDVGKYYTDDNPPPDQK